MNNESILKQFDEVETSLRRAKLPFETNFVHPNVIEVTLYELIKSYHQIENMVREIDPKRFGVSVQRSLHTPKLDLYVVPICPYCGHPDCTSDHK